MVGIQMKLLLELFTQPMVGEGCWRSLSYDQVLAVCIWILSQKKLSALLILFGFELTDSVKIQQQNMLNLNKPTL
jgi:hypothetical protein